jgi:filamentous hemagglutinin family protein
MIYRLITYRSWLLGIVSWCALSFCGNWAFAQITPDSTLPNNSSVQQQDSTFNITGGTTAGSNLFHSFSEFSVPNGTTASFNNAPEVQNIITRVTGNSVSNIDGTIRALQTANVFLLNPNGVILGPNARLDVGGSFVTTTASEISFGEQGFFSASNPNNPALLTVNPSALWFNQVPAAPIQYNGTAAPLEPPSSEPPPLRVRDGQSLLLVGGDITINNGRLNAFGGRVELGGLAQPGTVNLNVDGNNLSLNFPTDIERASVSLDSGSILDVGSGNITINAQHLNILEGSQLQTSVNSGLETLNNQGGDITLNATRTIRIDGQSSLIQSFVLPNATATGGNINITTESLEVTNGARLSSLTLGQGSSGNVNINARDRVLFEGSASNGDPSGIFSLALQSSSGNGGDINIKAGSFSLTNGAFVFAVTNGDGDAAAVTIDADNIVTLNGSNIFNTVQQNGQGNAGGINIKASSVTLANGTNLFTDTNGMGNGSNVAIDASDGVSFNGSNLFSRVLENGTGNAGSISIKASSVTLANGANFFTDTNGIGNGGNITIDAGDAVSFDGSNLFSRVLENGTGNAGSINIKASSVTLGNGVNFFTDTNGIGNGGNITIDAGDAVSFDGSNLFSRVLENGNGNAGSISIKASSISLANGANFFTDTNGIGNGGDITIDAGDTVSLNGSSIFSRVLENGNGNAGSVNVKTGFFSATNRAGIFTETNGKGNAGNVIIDSRNTISFDGQGSGIFKGVNLKGEGNSGEIRLIADSLFLTGGAILNTSTQGQGNGGDVIIQASNRVLFDRSFLFNTVNPEAKGNGGDISITSDDVSLTNGTIITFSTGGEGDAGDAIITTRSLSLTGGSLLTASTTTQNAGNIRINATESVTVSGSNPTNGRSTEISSDTLDTATGISGNIIIETNAFRVSDGAIINVRTTSNGAGGSINIKSQTFEATNGGQLITTTAGNGNAGKITVNASDSVSVNGIDATTSERINRFLNEPTGGLLANVGGASGFFVLSSGSGRAGDIEVTSPSIHLDNTGTFSAESASGDGGNINLGVGDLLLLRRGSQISATAGTAQQGGNGGNINIQAPNGFIVAVPNENSDISANAFTGSGGRVEIDAQGIFGITSRNSPSFLSDITASSQLGIPGIVQINTPVTDFSLGLVELPITLADASSIDTSCAAFANVEESRFIATGRGGLPPNPYQSLDSDVVWSDTRLPTLLLQPRHSEPRAVKPKSQGNELKMRPATGWVFNKKGEVTLISHASKTTQESTPTTCLTL